jgi:hypothetical protein
MTRDWLSKHADQRHHTGGFDENLGLLGSLPSRQGILREKQNVLSNGNSGTLRGKTATTKKFWLRIDSGQGSSAMACVSLWLVAYLLGLSCNGCSGCRYHVVARRAEAK